MLKNTKIVPSSQWHIIASSIHRNKANLVGIDRKFVFSNEGAEHISHFHEMQRVQELAESSLKYSGYVYLPITNHVAKMLEDINGNKYFGRPLHDGIIVDSSDNSIVEKVEFKSSQPNYYFGPPKLNKFIEK